MKTTWLSRPLVVLLCTLLAGPAFSPLVGAETGTALGRVLTGPPAQINGVSLPGDATLFNGDRLSTGANGWARVFLARGEQVHLGAQTQARATSQGETLTFELNQGQMALRGGRNVRVRSNGLELAAKADNAIWEVKELGKGSIVVASHRGAVEVIAANRTVEVPAGRTLALETTPLPPDQGGGGGSLTTVLVIGGILGGILATAIVATAVSGEGLPVSPSTP